MADMMKPARLLPGELKLRREVDRLHPKVEVELSPADVEYYRSLGAWAMVLDRQSKKKELKREEATGQANRVRNVLQMAQERGLLLPAPQENVHRKEGEFQFTFDEGPCAYHWFVDGMLGDASGFTASPYARLQLWRAAKVAKALRKHGCAPAAVLIGELSRFFRDQKQFLDWYHILKDSGAQVQIYGCPELTAESEGMLLPMLLCNVHALSWLRRQNQMSRQTRKEAGLLFSTRAPFGLQFNLDKTTDGYRKEVWVDPLEWPVLRHLVERVAAGAFRSRGQALVWFQAECATAGIAPDRVPRSRTWLRMLFFDPLLRGVYYQYDHHCAPCRIEDPEMDSDWDHMPSGRRRYVITQDLDEAVPFPILMEPADEIPLSQIQLAQQAFAGGRRRSDPDLACHRPTSLLREGTVVCCVCGHSVVERPPRIDPDRRWDPWTRAEDEQLLHLIHQGFTNRQIAAEMEVKLERVNFRRSKLKLRGKEEAADRLRLEDYWNQPFGRRMDQWHLACLCIQKVALQQAADPDAIRQTDLAQHCRHRNGSISLALEPLLWDALRQEPRLRTRPSSAAPIAPLSVLAAEEERFNSRICRLQTDYENQDWSVYTEAEVKVRLAVLRVDRARVQAEIAAIKGSALEKNERQSDQTWEETRQLLTQMIEHPQFTENMDLRRRLVELCVRRVEVDLKTGLWEAETNFHAPDLQRLCGEVLLGEVGAGDTGPRISSADTKNCILRGQVLLAA